MSRVAVVGCASFLGLLFAGCATGSAHESAPAASSSAAASVSSSAGPGGSSSSVSAASSGGGGAGGAGGASSSSIASSSGSGGGGGDGVGSACSVDGNPGTCEDASLCAAKSGYTSTPGYCPGPSDVECCAPTPNVADNPPVPAGWELMEQSEVTPAMSSWAVMILNDPSQYPMFSTAMQTFGALDVLARVEWHPPDFQNSVVHRGVTLYQPE